MNGENSYTLEQIARLAGVSCTTASRVINGRPGVKPSTRARVLETIKIYGYTPNPTAQRLATYRSRIASE